MARMSRMERMAGVVLLSAVAVACATPKITTVERTSRGPNAYELHIYRSFIANGREPTFDEKRYFEDRLSERVFKYLREHPEIQNDQHYSDFRFWRQVTPGSSKVEVETLLEDPDERTIDPALMAALASQQWTAISAKAKEAWVYPLGWVLYFDDKTVVEIVRRRGKWDKGDDD
jgi:hypothetical protein